MTTIVTEGAIAEIKVGEGDHRSTPAATAITEHEESKTQPSTTVLPWKHHLRLDSSMYDEDDDSVALSIRPFTLSQSCQTTDEQNPPR